MHAVRVDEAGIGHEGEGEAVVAQRFEPGVRRLAVDLDPLVFVALEGDAVHVEGECVFTLGERFAQAGGEDAVVGGEIGLPAVVAQAPLPLVARVRDLGQGDLDELQEVGAVDDPALLFQLRGEQQGLVHREVVGQLGVFQAQVGDHHDAVVRVQVGVDVPFAGWRVFYRDQIVALVLEPFHAGGQLLLAEAAAIRGGDGGGRAARLAEDEEGGLVDAVVDVYLVVRQRQGVGLADLFEHAQEQTLQAVGGFDGLEPAAGGGGQLLQQVGVGLAGQGDGVHGDAGLLQARQHVVDDALARGGVFGGVLGDVHQAVGEQDQTAAAGGVGALPVPGGAAQHVFDVGVQTQGADFAGGLACALLPRGVHRAVFDQHVGPLAEGPHAGAGIPGQQRGEQAQGRAAQIVRVGALHAAGDVDQHAHVVDRLGAVRRRPGRGAGQQQTEHQQQGRQGRGVMGVPVPGRRSQWCRVCQRHAQILENPSAAAGFAANPPALAARRRDSSPGVNFARDGFACGERSTGRPPSRPRSFSGIISPDISRRHA